MEARNVLDPPLHFLRTLGRVGDTADLKKEGREGGREGEREGEEILTHRSTSCGRGVGNAADLREGGREGG